MITTSIAGAPSTNVTTMIIAIITTVRTIVTIVVAFIIIISSILVTTIITTIIGIINSCSLKSVPGVATSMQRFLSETALLKHCQPLLQRRDLCIQLNRGPP